MIKYLLLLSLLLPVSSFAASGLIVDTLVIGSNSDGAVNDFPDTQMFVLDETFFDNAGTPSVGSLGMSGEDYSFNMGLAGMLSAFSILMIWSKGL